MINAYMTTRDSVHCQPCTRRHNGKKAGKKDARTNLQPGAECESDKQCHSKSCKTHCCSAAVASSCMSCGKNGGLCYTSLATRTSAEPSNNNALRTGSGTRMGGPSTRTGKLDADGVNSGTSYKVIYYLRTYSFLISNPSPFQPA